MGRDAADLGVGGRVVGPRRRTAALGPGPPPSGPSGLDLLLGSPDCRKPQRDIKGRAIPCTDLHASTARYLYASLAAYLFAPFALCHITSTPAPASARVHACGQVTVSSDEAPTSDG